MLARSARRIAHHDAFRNTTPGSEGLHLPWLCPAQLRFRSQRRSSTSCRGQSLPPRVLPLSNQSFSSRNGRRGRRRFATVTVEEPLSSNDIIPWASHPTSQPRPQLSSPGWPSADLQFDPSSLLQLDYSTYEANKRHRGTQPGSFGGNLTEMHAMLDACLKVNRLQRAALIIRRLENIYHGNSHEWRALHHEYLKTLLRKAITERDAIAFKDAQKYYEIKIRLSGTRADADVYAYLVKGSLNFSHGPKRERTVRRYYDFAKFDERDLEMFQLPILSDAEISMVTMMCSEQFYQASQELEPDDTTTTSLPSLDPTQAVREVPQKGQGLHSLRRSLSVFSEAVIESDNSPDGTDQSLNKDTHARQLQLEEDSINAAIERWKIEHEKLARLRVGSSLRGQTLGSLMWDWHKSLKPLIEEELKQLDKAEVKEIQNEEDRDRCAYGPFLRVLSVDKLSAITILTAINSLSFEGFEKGARLGQLVAAVGNTVEEESNADDVNVRAKMHGPDLSTAWKRSKRLRTLQRVKSKSPTPLSAAAVERANATQGNDKPESVRWTLSQKIKVGSVLVSALTKAAKLSVQRIHPTTQEVINQVQPAFNHVYLIKRGRKLGMLFMNTVLIEKVKKEPVPHVIAKYLPMVVEPTRWTGFSKGGYIRYPTRVVRIKDADICQLQYAKTAAKRGDLDQVFAGLDVLGKVPWMINRKVFDVMLEAWNTGEALADIPPADPKIDFPPEPAPSATRDERYNWTRRVRELENEKSGLHSQRCFQNFQLEVAKAFRDEKFYFPHNVDFRGRAYPIPPYLNHMGADNARGLLLFAEAKELGAAGLVWLKIHLANVFGYDKASFREREDFTMEHMADIFDSASRPLGGSRWWLKAEDPWQCLATCIELKSALESPDPSRFKSRLPIHQDGTCNGLQHYAALGGDAWGAKQVNLEPGERPADVYTAVAEEIKRDISEDAHSGLAVAKLLDGFITRKVVKQTVMTNVYGVTFVGASAQVRRQLTEVLPNTVALDMPYSKLSRYVAKKIFKALSAMFGGAHEIQFWLAECAKRISEAVTPAQIEQLIARSTSDGVTTEPVKRKRPFFRTPVIWTTPLKMPVVQPYRKFEAKSVATTMQQITIFEPSPTDPVSKRKQLQAFPPNFVHSLDATHMLLSALKCNEAGLTFASVHDSFWTHAGSIDSMNCILRDSFIRIHSEDVIGRLAAEFRARYKDCLYYTAIPSAGPAGKKIKEWRRGQSTEIRRNSKSGNIQTRELFLERERLDLLSSTDPEDVERGRKMVTPASILEDHGGEPFGFFERAECVKVGSAPADGSSPLEDTPTAENYSAPDLDVHETSDLHEDDKPKRAASALHIWLPLRFPDVPKKGDFDVSRLKDSLYFFS